MKLIIHIGTPKTGSTSLQVFLHQNADQLKYRGFSAIEPMGNINAQALLAYIWLSENIDFKLRSLPANLMSLDRAGREAFLKTFSKDFSSRLDRRPRGTDTLILSCEGLWTFGEKGEDEIARLRNFVSEFSDEVQIVVYLRRQDRRAVSWYSTKLRNFQTDNTLDFSKEYAEYYHEKLTHWSNVFGKDAISIRIFDKEALHRGSVIDDFAKTIDLPLNNRFLRPARLNTSLNKDGQDFLKWLNRVMPTKQDDSIENYKRRKFVNLASYLFPGQGYLPPREEARNFYIKQRGRNNLRDDNNRVARDFLNRDVLFSEDFSEYPEQFIPIDESLDRVSGILRKLIHSLPREFGREGALHSSIMSDSQTAEDVVRRLYQRTSVQDGKLTIN